MKQLPNLSFIKRSAGHDRPAPVEGPAAPPIFELVFPPDHALAQLNRLWSGVSGEDPLYLRLHPDAGIPKYAGAEADTLRFSLTHLANRRLRQVVEAKSSAACAVDEYALVHVTRDGMAAWLLLLPPVGAGRTLSAGDIRQALARRGVVYGLDESFIDQLPTLSQRYFQLFPIAAGVPPVHGADGQIIDRYPRQAPAGVQVEDLDHADYQTLHLVQSINEGDIICEIVPPTQKVDGISVSGSPVRARAGAQPFLPQGRNTALSEDGTRLIATRAGHVEFSGHTFQVKPVLEIFDNVDEKTGDIHFLGDVHIHGDVSQGITIRAMGNIQVDGVIGSCTIEAGENLIVASGIQGQDAAVIRSHKSIYAKYLEHCTVYARDNVLADYIIGCNIFSNGTVKARTGRGVIVGGIVRSAMEVSANTVGSKAECVTAIVIDGLPYNDFERSQLRDEVANTERELAQLEQMAVSPERQKAQSSLNLALCVAKLKLEKFNKECQALVASAHLTNDSRCLICNTAYPGTELSIDGQTIRLSETVQNCLFRLINGRLSRSACQ